MIWKIWTKIYSSARNLLVHHSSLSHTTYVETNKDEFSGKLLVNAFTRKTLKFFKNETSVFKNVLDETFISFPIIYRFTNVLHKYMNSATAGMGSYRV